MYFNRSRVRIESEIQGQILPSDPICNESMSDGGFPPDEQAAAARHWLTFVDIRCRSNW